MREHPTPPRRCPECGEILNAALSATGHPEPPRPGDLSMCVTCGELLCFDAEGNLAALTAADRAAIAANPRLAGLMIAAEERRRVVVGRALLREREKQEHLA